MLERCWSEVITVLDHRCWLLGLAQRIVDGESKARAIVPKRGFFEKMLWFK
jgi:hypothetical protein